MVGYADDADSACSVLTFVLVRVLSALLHLQEIDDPLQFIRFEETMLYTPFFFIVARGWCISDI
jgi:hypothetical protein